MEGVGLSVSVTDLSTIRYTYHSLQERSDIKFRAPHVDGHSVSHMWTNRFDDQEERHPLVIRELSVSPFDGVIGWSRLFHARDQESGVVQGAGVVLERAVESDHRLLPGRCRPKGQDRKSTRLNSSHLVISYAVFCLKKKKKHRERST